MAKIPDFKTEKEEAEFWDTHDSTDFLEDTEELKEKMYLSPELKKKLQAEREKRVFSMRLEKRQIEMAKRLARRKACSYQQLLRMWIEEGIQRARFQQIK